MKIVKILGGLGNQMFQYALYLALKEHFPDEEIKIDTSCFCAYPLHNGYELNKLFHIDAKEASFIEKAKNQCADGGSRCQACFCCIGTCIFSKQG